MPKEMINSERKYRKITFQQRQQLIRLIIDEKKKIADAARQVKINPSTARIIIQNYKEEGRIYEKRSERLQRRQKQATEPIKPDSTESEEKSENKPNIVPSFAIMNYPSFFEAQVPIYFQWFPSTF